MRTGFLLSAVILLFVCRTPAIAQSLSCNLTTDDVKFRAEGVTEPIGDVLIQCAANDQTPAGQSYITGDVKIYINTSIVNRTGVGGGSNTTDIVLIVNENHAPPASASSLGGPQKNVPIPQYGQIVAANQIQFSSVKIPIPGAKAADGSTFPPRTILRVTNMRINASQLGVSSTLIAARVVLFAASVADAAAIQGANQQVILGTIAIGATTQVSSPASLPQCQSQNIVNGVVSGPPTFSVRFTEGFESAFRPLGQPTTDRGIHAGEDGYTTPGIGANGGGADQGTRLRVVLNGVALGLRIAVPITLTNGSLSLQLITTTDSNGNGPYKPVTDTGLAELMATNGTATAIYEVVKSDNTAIESVEIPFVVGYIANPASNLPNLGSTIVGADFAPTTFSVTSSTAAIPRFIDFSSVRNAFFVNKCIPSPVITGVQPSSLPAGTGMDNVLRLDGTGFIAGSVVEWNGTALPTILNTDATPYLMALVSASLTAQPGTAQLDVLNLSIQRSNAVEFSVTARPSLPPTINPGGTVNAAGSMPLLARGSIASIYGLALANSTASPSGFPLPLTLAGVKVTVSGKPAPLFYVSPAQINFQVPFETALTGTATIVVTRDGVDSDPASVALAEFAPGIFRAGSTPIILHADYSLVTLNKPALPNEILIAYGTGLGGLSSLPITGSPTPASPAATARLLPSITIGGQPAKVPFAGLASGFAGLAQFNFQVPASLPPGSVQTLVLGYGSNTDSAPLVVKSGVSPAFMITSSIVTRTPVPKFICAVPWPETNFLTTDPLVWITFTYANAVTGDKGRLEWIDPTGKLYLASDIAQFLVGSACYGYYIGISEFPPALSPGAWRVRLLWNGVEGFNVPFNISLPPADPITILSSTLLHDGAIGQSYLALLDAINGTKPYVWTNPDGNLPPGLEISSIGLLFGTPTAVGSFNFQLRVTDSAGATSTRTFGLGVAPKENSIQHLYDGAR